jgi:hypothetical protein
MVMGLRSSSEDASEAGSAFGLVAAGAAAFVVFFAEVFGAVFSSVLAGAAVSPAASVKRVEISESVCDKLPVSWANLWVDKVVIMSDFLSFSVVEFQ